VHLSSHASPPLLPSLPPTLPQAKGPTGDSIETELANLVAKIREGMTLRRASQLVVDQGVVACYVHNAAGPLMGQVR